jgi:hypothetical protein
MEIRIIIESVFVLYIVARVAGAGTFSTQHRKNPGPYPSVEIRSALFFGHFLFECMDLLGDAKFQARWHRRGGGDSGDGGGGRSGGRDRGSGSGDGVVHLNVRTVLTVWISVFGAVASHVALGPAPKAASLGTVLGMLLVSEFLKR